MKKKTSPPSKQQPVDPRRPYARPILEKIQVRLDEVMATGCKAGGLGPAIPDPCSSCHDIGS